MDIVEERNLTDYSKNEKRGSHGMSLVSKIFGKGHGKVESGGTGTEAGDRLAADRVRSLRVSSPVAQSADEQQSVRAHMEQELDAQRLRRQGTTGAE
jgi:hypothetical protein